MRRVSVVWMAFAVAFGASLAVAPPAAAWERWGGGPRSHWRGRGIPPSHGHPALVRQPFRARPYLDATRPYLDASRLGDIPESHRKGAAWSPLGSQYLDSDPIHPDNEAVPRGRGGWRVIGVASFGVEGASRIGREPVAFGP